MFAFSADLSEVKYAAMSLKTTVRLVSGKMNRDTPVPMPNPVKKASNSFLMNASAYTTANYRLDMLLFNQFETDALSDILKRSGHDCLAGSSSFSLC